MRTTLGNQYKSPQSPVHAAPPIPAAPTQSVEAAAVVSPAAMDAATRELAAPSPDTVLTPGAGAHQLQPLTSAERELPTEGARVGTFTVTRAENVLTIQPFGALPNVSMKKVEFVFVRLGDDSGPAVIVTVAQVLNTVDIPTLPPPEATKDDVGDALSEAASAAASDEKGE